MKGSLRWIGLLTFFAALVWGPRLSAIQDKGSPNNRGTNPTNKAPYRVEHQMGYCPDGKECSSPQREPNSSAVSRRVRASDELESKPVPEPAPANIKERRWVEPKSNLPWEGHTPPTGGHAGTTNHSELNLDDHYWQRAPLPLTPGSSPIVAIAVVGAGVLTGLVGSLVILKFRFAKPLATRPNGDIARSYIRDKRPDQPWEKAVPDTEVFQLQNALRRKLILRDEFRELRSRYLIAGNFSFSMLSPISLALILLNMSFNKWYATAGIWIVGALTTTLLTTYALDRRHRFRSAYRTLIVHNLKPSQETGNPTPPPDAALRWEVFRQLVSILLVVMQTWGGAKDTSTENSGEKGDE